MAIFRGLMIMLKNILKKFLHKKIFPVTAKEYVASSVFALTIFNGADQALLQYF